MLDELGIGLRYIHAGAAFHQKRFRDPAELLRGQPIVFLHRDPIDTTVSGYFQVTKREAWRELFVGDISKFVRDPVLGLERTLRFNRMWLLQIEGRKEAVVTTYELLMADAVQEIVRIAECLGEAPNVKDIRAAVASASFENMQAKEAIGGFAEDYTHRLTPASSADPESYKVRRGKVGGYADYLNKDDIAFCRHLIEKYEYTAPSL